MRSGSYVMCTPVIPVTTSPVFSVIPGLRSSFQLEYTATSLITSHFLNLQPSKGHALKLMTGSAGSLDADLPAGGGVCAANREHAPKQSIARNRRLFMDSR